ncbi:EPS15 homology (EH) [Lasallia pustulata]|uniref:EPS15 homology (EH) n=1 Tax=Lasallia pustulata TaxID=136370 RepID=A0A1W5D5P3_9LECA|nr:EPS15 homology (EH) [Lasallia pustulata]
MANNYSGVNGALAAATATFAATGRQKKPVYVAPVDRSANGTDSTKLAESISFRDHPSSRVGSGSFGALQPSHSVRGRSPSQIAATLAVSRCSSNDRQALPTPGATLGSRRVSPFRNAHGNPHSKASRPEFTSNARTNTLVELFESKNAPKHSGSGPDAAGVPRKVASATSVRPRFAKRSSTNNALPFPGQTDPCINPDHMQSPLLHGAAKLDFGSSSAAVTAARLASPLKAHRPQLVVQPAAGCSKPEPPPSRRWPHQQIEVVRQDQPFRGSKGTCTEDLSTATYNSTPKSTPGTLPLVGGATKDENHRGVSTDDAGTLQGGFAPQSSSARTPSVSTQVCQVPISNARTRETRPTHHQAQSQMTVDSLANAIVASSLASSRAPSPTKSIQPLARRHNKPYSLFRQHHNHDQSDPRTPSPNKGMRQTMRAPPKSDDDDENKRGSSSIIKKHPHKHHEGDRKRWRNQITERERKRYEGVWAANRGICLPDDSHSAVCNLVVRDIWSRSRLSNHVLEEVWDLVDNEGFGRLNREEFVVGMWLIDQSLKGRKLPVKVSDSVWFSVRRLTGIKIPKNRR